MSTVVTITQIEKMVSKELARKVIEQTDATTHVPLKQVLKIHNDRMDPRVIKLISNNKSKAELHKLGSYMLLAIESQVTYCYGDKYGDVIKIVYDHIKDCEEYTLEELPNVDTDHPLRFFIQCADMYLRDKLYQNFDRFYSTLNWFISNMTFPDRIFKDFFR